MRQQEGVAHQRRQTVEHGIDALQGFAHEQTLFRRLHQQFRLLRQGFQPRLLQRQTPVMVDQQALRHGRQVGARLAQALPAVRRRRQQAHEGILRQVGRMVGALQLGAQPTHQPAVVVTVDAGY